MPRVASGCAPNPWLFRVLRVRVATNVPPVVSVTEPASGASVIVPSTVTLEAIATSADRRFRASPIMPERQRSARRPPCRTRSLEESSCGKLIRHGRGKGRQRPHYNLFRGCALGDTGSAPTVTMTAAPKSGTSLIGPATVTLSASATSADETVMSVAYFNAQEARIVECFALHLHMEECGRQYLLADRGRDGQPWDGGHLCAVSLTVPGPAADRVDDSRAATDSRA